MLVVVVTDSGCGELGANFKEDKESVGEKERECMGVHALTGENKERMRQQKEGDSLHNLRVVGDL